MINIDDLYIVNYCNQNCIPLKNIARLPKDEAFLLASEMVTRNKGTSFGRFEDFQNYYPLRMKTDRYLYDTFLSIGGKPKEEHPLSFVFQGSDFLNTWFDNGIVTKILLKDIPSEYISFTYGDSAATLERTGEVTVITKEMLLESICEFDGTIEEYMEQIVKNYHYIEVQLWNDDCCISKEL